MSKINKYRKYKYIIWSDEDGFHSLESLSEDDLKSMSAALKTEISTRKRHSDNEEKRESDSK